MKKILIAILMAVAAPAWATTIYLNACGTGADRSCVPGSDSNDGLTDVAPKLTMAAAITATGGSARVVRVGTCGVVENVDTTLTANITIESYSPHTSKDACQLQKPILREARAGHDALTVSTCTDCTIRNVTIEGGGTGRTGVVVSATNAILDRVTIRGFATGFSCSTGATAERIELKNSTVTGNTIPALVACANTLLENNKFDANGDSLKLDGGFSGAGKNMIVRGGSITHTANLTGGRCSAPAIVAYGRHVSGPTIENVTITETDPMPACLGISLGDSYGSGSGQEGFTGAIIRGNTLVNLGGGAIGVSSCQNCAIENNLIAHDGALGSNALADDFIAIKAPGKATGSGDLTNAGLKVVNNSIYLNAATAGSKAIAVNTEGTGHVISSNLIEMGAGANASTQCFDTTGLAQSAFASVNYNLCHRVGGTAKWSQVYVNLAAAQAAATAWDVNGSAASPKLIATPASDTQWSMATAFGSPAINAGDPARATRLAYKGHPKVAARDIGAQEYEAQGKNFIVATSGSDSNDGLTLASAFRTIGHAKDIVNAGDIIEIRSGTYNESLVISRPGTSTAWITMRGYNGELPIIRGTTAGPSVYFYTTACEDAVTAGLSGNTDCTPMYWTVSGLFIQGSASGAEDGNAIKIDTPKVRVQGNKLCCSFADVVKLVRTANDAQIIDNEIWQDAAITTISDNAQGVDSVGTDRIRVAGNYVHDITSIGMYCKGNCRNALFENNIIKNIGDHGIMVGQETDADLLLDGDYEAYDAIVRNNVVINTDRACVAVSSAQNIKVLNNSCYNTGLVQHGTMFLSNESIIATPSDGVEIANNIFYGNTALPIIKITADAFADFTTLNIHDNIYWSSDGAPKFQPNAEFSPIAAAAWATAYSDLTSHTDNSRMVNPKFETLTGTTPLTLSPDSPAINTGVTNAAVTKDFRWITRPQGPKPEVGAYEFTRSAFVDDIAPTVYSANPAASASFVPVNTTITVTFSEAIDCATVTLGNFTVSGGVTGAITCDGASAALTPSANLSYSTTYTVTLSTDIKDLGGNRLTGTRTWVFTTVAAPATGFDFSFLVYGDSRAGNTCDGNNVHQTLVGMMAAEPASLVVHVGDMIAGLYQTTNWTNNGVCPTTGSVGSFLTEIGPLRTKTPSAGLSNFFFPVIGNHDDGWGDGWYPDPYGGVFCSVFNPNTLVPNHTSHAEYFLDQTSRVEHYSDVDFYTKACSSTDSSVYSRLMYYTFKFKNSQFIIMRLNTDPHDLMECNTCGAALDNYDDYYYKHQLDWLKYTLTQAQADTGVQNIFVFTHAPLITRADSHSANVSWPYLLKEFSARPKVKAVFSGHDHVYERSYPIYATSGTPAGVRNDTTGVVYYTTGGGGSPLDGFAGTEPRMAVGLATYHYIRVEVSGSSVTTTTINSAGSTIDTYTYSR